MSAICLIPARFHSSRFPGKLLALAEGKTVLQRTFENARRCRSLDLVCVATDHEQIAEHIQKLGGEVIWTSSSCLNGTQRLIEALHKTPHLQKADIILNVQGDHPCTSPEAMEAVLKILREDREAVMSTAVISLKKLRHFLSPHIVKCVFDQHQNALYFSRAPIPYCRKGLPKNAHHHIGIYAYRTSFLLSSLGGEPTSLQAIEDLEQLAVLERGFRIKVAVINDPPFGVDTPEDLISLEKFLKKLRDCPQT